MSGLVALAGSRSLPLSESGRVVRVVEALRRAGRSLLVGDALGADLFALRAALSALCAPWAAGALRVFAAVAEGGALVRRLAGAHSPVAVSWSAGGPPALPARVRLAARTRALVAAAAAGPRPGSGLVVFLASPSSPGSLLAARSALAAGLPVVCFPCGFPAAELPELSVGTWAPLPAGPVWGGSFRWVPAPF
jgi:hypothetical protein